MKRGAQEEIINEELISKKSKSRIKQKQENALKLKKNSSLNDGVGSQAGKMSIHSFLDSLGLTDTIKTYFPQDFDFYSGSNAKMVFPIDELNDKALSAFYSEILKNEEWGIPNKHKINIAHFEIPKDYIEAKEKEFEEIYSGKEKDNAKLLMYCAIAIRIVIEKTKIKLPLYTHKHSLEESKADFQALKAHSGAYLNNSLVGMKASNYFMQDQRFNCARESNLSFSEVWEAPQLVGKLVSYLKKNKCLKQNFVNGLTRDFVPAQFKPATIKYLCHLIHEKTNKKVEKYLNLCGGWGDRLVGALATDSIKRYIETDPNTNLLPIVKMIQAAYDPDNETTCYFYDKPMEDLSEQELNPDNVRNDLVAFSPPYFKREEYPGSEQSYNRYNKIDSWVYNFLYHSVHVSYKALDTGGVLAINLANITGKKSIKLLDCLKYYLDNDLSHYYEKLAEPLIYDTKSDFTKSKNTSEIVLYRTKAYQPELFHMPPKAFKLDERWFERNYVNKYKGKTALAATKAINSPISSQTPTPAPMPISTPVHASAFRALPQFKEKELIPCENLIKEIGGLEATIKQQELFKEKYRQIVATCGFENKKDIQEALAKIDKEIDEMQHEHTNGGACEALIAKIFSYNEHRNQYQYYLNCYFYLENIDNSINAKRERIKILNKENEGELNISLARKYFSH